MQRLLTRFVAKRSDDLARKMFVNLAVSWHWLHNAGLGVSIPIVLGAVSDKDATEAFKLAN